MSVSTRVVHIAAASLPRSLRERYLEQWLADVRDASEQGLRPAQVALGSVAFAATVGRPFPERAELAPADAARRASIARGLALSAALLGISQYANEGNLNGPGMGAVLDAMQGLATIILTSYAALAVILAFALLIATRGVSARTRWAVVLFAIAATTPIVLLALASSLTDWGAYDQIATTSPLVYLGAVILIVVGVALNLSSGGSAPAPVRSIILAGLAVLVGGALALGDAFVRYLNRPPLRFGMGARTVINPLYAQWLQLKVHAESEATTLFVWCAIILMVLAVALIVTARVRRLGPRALVLWTTATVATVFIAAAGVFGYFTEFYSPSTLVEGPALLIFGRVILLLAILAIARGGTSPETVSTPSLTLTPGRPSANVSGGGKRRGA